MPECGDIYLGQIAAVDPARQEVIVDLGAELRGRLPLAEIHPSYLDLPVTLRERLLAELRGDQLEPTDRARAASPLAPYDLGEVVRLGTVILVQVVRAGDGTEDPSLTAYLALTGRHCVLRPNAIRDGRVATEIGDPAHRRRLAGLLNDLDLPQGMALDVMAGGNALQRMEIARDLDRLMRHWRDLRDRAMASTPPTAIRLAGRLP
ncbi:MAG: ribonuclease E/G [Pseudomonadota bacterium]